MPHEMSPQQIIDVTTKQWYQPTCNLLQSTPRTPHKPVLDKAQQRSASMRVHAAGQHASQFYDHFASRSCGSMTCYTCCMCSNMTLFSEAFRSAGWPWGQFGVVDEPSPKRKKQATSHHKRSTSPASRTTSRKSVAGAAPDDEVSKPPAKRAKRTARVGAAKVVKRGPGRRGEPCMLRC